MEFDAEAIWVSEMRTGLLHRLRRARRQMIDQHRHLGAIRAELLRALPPAGSDHALEVWRSYSEAIQAHFVLENETFFPALHGLRPEFSSDLGALDRDHEAFLAHFALIEQKLRAHEIASGAIEIHELNIRLAEHEQREEAVVARITEEFPIDASPIDFNAT